MKKFIGICLLCAMSASMLTSCGKPNLEGRWGLCNADGEELDVEIKFKDDGTMKIDGEKGEYKVIDKDSIKIDGEECGFEIIDEDKSLIYIRELADKKEQQNINQTALTLMKAVNSALCDIDEEDIYYKDNTIICSDSSKNINAVAENARADFDFIKWTRSFFNDIDNYEYIIYITDDLCANTAVKSPSNDIIGTYPEGEFDGMTFDEIYAELKGRTE